ncbi:hypothetical protein [Mucilaginibacter oryzae]|nr:hypothetical protein [Mucilaginibacter oryzae]
MTTSHNDVDKLEQNIKSPYNIGRSSWTKPLNADSMYDPVSLLNVKGYLL